MAIRTHNSFRAGLSRLLLLWAALAAAAVPSGALAQALLAPVIYTQPQNRTVSVGTSVTLSVDANGYPALQYFWRKNGLPYSPGQTNTSSLLVPGSVASSGNYDVVITNSYGAVTSLVAILLVNTQAPGINTEPQSQTACSGSLVAFNATVNFGGTNGGGGGYQWRLDGNDLPGRGGLLPGPFITNFLRLNLTNVSGADAGNYTLVLSNNYGMITSAIATLTLDPPAPFLSQQPKSVATSVGASVSFSLTAFACSSLTYHWRSNGVELAGPNSNRLSVAASSAQSTMYDAVVTASGASTTSRVAWLVVSNWPPTLSCQPQSRTVYAGSNATFSVCASGQLPLSYQWRHDGSPLLPATNLSSFTVHSALPPDAGDYDVIVTNLSGAVTSSVATLTVLLSAPTILTNPVSQSVAAGQTAAFSVKASGAPPASYEWQKDGVNLDGKTNSTLILANVTFADAGQYRAIASNLAGSVPSSPATLTVTPGSPPVIDIQPQDQTISLSYGSNAYFYVYASGLPPLTYQWFHNDQLITNATDYGLIVWPVAPGDRGDYYVVVANGSGAVTSAVVRLTVLPFSLYVYSVSDYNLGGSGVVELGSPREIYFASYTDGPGISFYQWFHNGEAIARATNDSLTLGPMTTSDSGDYWLVAGNPFGVVTSAVSSLTVLIDSPYIYSPPMDVTVPPGAGNAAYLAVGATGALPLDFYWFHNGQAIAGSPANAFNNLVYFGPVTTNDAGTYFVVVSNFVGMITSAVVTVRVEYTPPSILSPPYDFATVTGGNATFCVYAGGTPPLSYQWQFFGTNIDGAISTCLYLYGLSTNQAGEYRVVVSNGGGSVTSSVARLSVLPNLPVFTTVPVSQDAGLGATVVLSFGSTNGVARWQFNGEDILGIPPNSLPNLWLDDLGTNQAGVYTTVVTNSEGSVTSPPVTLTVSSGPLDRWQWRNPLPQGNDLYHVASGGGAMVAVGAQGAKVVSRDGGVTWEAHNRSGADLQRVAYGNGVFVGISSFWLEAEATWTGYRLQTSTNGIDWADRRLDLTDFDQLLDVAFGNGRFVAVANFGGVIVSSNGVDWVKSNWTNYWTMGHVTFGNGRFVIADRGGSTVSLALSSDGVSWTNSSVSGAGYVLDLAFGNGQFALLGNPSAPWIGIGFPVLSISQDGVSWSTQQLDPANNTFHHLAAGNGKFVAVGDYGSVLLASSSDGVTWRDHSAGISNGLYGVAFCNGQFVAVGNFGTILASADGETWRWVNTNTSINIRSLARGNGRYVAAGNEGTVYNSADGGAWARLSLPTSANLRGVTFGAGTFVVVGANDAGSNTLFTSPDGFGWTRRNVGTNGSIHDFYNVLYAAGLFVAVGESGTITTSTNGVAWTDQFSGNPYRLNSLTYGGGTFVAVGKKARVSTSPDGVNWSTRSYAGLLKKSSEFLQGIAYGNGLYVAAGQSGGLLVSSNALDWTAPASPFSTPAESFDIEDVQFANGLFIAVGENGLIATSPDGVLWTRRYSGCANDLRGALYADCHFFAVGNNETILESDFNGPPMLALAAPSGSGNVQLSVHAEMGNSYRLQVSTNLLDWIDLLRYTNLQAVTPWQDTNASTHTRRFYRVVSP